MKDNNNKFNNNLQNKQLLVTVGTTKFDKLIKAIDCKEFYTLLDSKLFNSLIIQKGNGEYTPVNYNYLINNNTLKCLKDIKVVEYVSNFNLLISNSDIIISHCGAGTILETLKNKKTFIGIINDTLMDNHQLELADTLGKEKYIYYTDVNNILKKLKNILDNNEYSLKTNIEINYSLIPSIIDSLIDR